jgi:hypothetical protein
VASLELRHAQVERDFIITRAYVTANPSHDFNYGTARVSSAVRAGVSAAYAYVAATFAHAVVHMLHMVHMVQMILLRANVDVQHMSHHMHLGQQLHLQQYLHVHQWHMGL